MAFSSLTRDLIPGFGAWNLSHWTTREVPITHFQWTVKNNNHAIQKHLFLLSQTWYQGQLVLSSQQFWKLRIFFSFILYGEYRGSERQSKQSQHHTAYRGGNTYVCGALCDQALCPRTVQSEEEGIQKLNAIFPTLEMDMFPRITFFFFFADWVLWSLCKKHHEHEKEPERRQMQRAIGVLWPFIMMMYQYF